MPTVMDKAPVQIPLGEGHHKPGCPESRVENYEAQRPGEDERPVTVVRCADCGGHQVHEGGIARVARKFTQDTTEGKATSGRREGNSEASGAERRTREQ